MNNLYSNDIEENVLGFLIVYEECKRYIAILDGTDFYSQINKTIFELIKEIEKEEIPINILSIKQKAIEKKLEANEIFKTCTELTNTVITSTTIEPYIQKLKTYSTRRQLRESAYEIIRKIDEDVEDNANELKRECIEEIAKVKSNQMNIEDDTMSSVMIETMDDIENKANNKDDNRYKTGFFKLDNATDGLHEQELTIIAARPGCGKTALALNIAEHIAAKGIYTYFVSLEMSKKQLGSRLISSKANIDSHIIRSGWLEKEDFKKIATIAGKLCGLKMIIDDKSTTIQEIETKAIYLKEIKNIGLIVVDYLQLLKSKNKYSIREQEVSEISRKLKLLSKDLNIPIIAICQLNRESVKKERPSLSDLRESGALEQDADNVIFIFAEEEEKQKAITETEIIIAKQRNGPVGTAKLKFHRKTMTFTNNC